MKKDFLESLDYKEDRLFTTFWAIDPANGNLPATYQVITQGQSSHHKYEGVLAGTTYSEMQFLPGTSIPSDLQGIIKEKVTSKIESYFY